MPARTAGRGTKAGSARRSSRSRDWSSLVGRYAFIGELILIALWALFLGRGYLDMDPRMIPPGGEFGIQIQSNYLWMQALKCGWCAVWRGAEQGGLPALVDIHGSMLNPVVIVTTLIWGVVNGVKVTLLVSLWLAGVAQWWIARQMNLGALPRLYAAGIAIAGGHLASKMELANHHFVVAAAFWSLLLGALVHLGLRGGKRAVVIAASALACFVLSGQGYLQVGMLGVLPSAAFVLFSDRSRLPQIWKELALTALLAILLAAPLLIPVLHFAPNLEKATDPSLKTAQALAYLPLNLIIDDRSFYRLESLGTVNSPQLYSLFIGWIPVVLAVLGLSNVRKPNRGATWFMASAAVLAFLVAGGGLWKGLLERWPELAGSVLVGGLRYPSVVSGLAVPCILALSASGLHHLWQSARSWPTLAISVRTTPGAPGAHLPLQWLIVIPLIASLVRTYEWAVPWYQLKQSPQFVEDVLLALRTDSLQWVQPPQHWEFLGPGVALGLKMTPGWSDVRWRGRELPKPALIATWEGVPKESTGQIGQVGIAGIFATGEEYATVVTPDGSEACRGAGSGGAISVRCESSEAGRLIVHETTWDGWFAWMDGKPIPLLGTDWLEVESPVGSHTFTFRYLPWDVPVGLVLFGLGVAASVWFLLPLSRPSA